MSSVYYRALIISYFLVARVLAVDKCAIGTYRHDKAPWQQGCPGFKACEQGYYCDGNIKIICPSGVYGDDEGLTLPSCSGPCPPGYYCPSGTILPHTYKCGNTSTYCPEGSSLPLDIPSGFYGIGNSAETYYAVAICPPGHYCFNGEKYSCPAGRFGDRTGLSSSDCAGECPGGWYCPTGTIGATDKPCGASSHTFCPPGAARPTPTTLGFYTTEAKHGSGGGYAAEKRCPPGSFCVEGQRSLCPAGRFGAIHESINSSCDGECFAGW